MSENQKKYLNNIKKEIIIIRVSRLFILLIFFSSWEFLSRTNRINTFIYSSPSMIYKTFISLYENNNLFLHIYTTIFETIIAFSLGILIGFIIALILYQFKMFAKIIDPFLVILNSLPKVALGPLIIIIAGANTKSIIIMALLINVIINITTIYNGFLSTDEIKLKLFKSLNASKIQILKLLVIPSCYPTIITGMKLNISLSLIGVITGEFLTSKNGIGYLIIYGTQVFNLSLVYTGILMLIIISFFLYKIVSNLEKKLIKNEM